MRNPWDEALRRTSPTSGALTPQVGQVVTGQRDLATSLQTPGVVSSFTGRTPTGGGTLGPSTFTDPFTEPAAPRGDQGFSWPVANPTVTMPENPFQRDTSVFTDMPSGPRETPLPELDPRRPWFPDQEPLPGLPGGDDPRRPWFPGQDPLPGLPGGPELPDPRVARPRDDGAVPPNDPRNGPRDPGGGTTGGGTTGGGPVRPEGIPDEQWEYILGLPGWLREWALNALAQQAAMHSANINAINANNKAALDAMKKAQGPNPAFFHPLGGIYAQQGPSRSRQYYNAFVGNRGR